MTDKDKEREWDKEMAQVDRLLQKLPTYATEKPPSGGYPTPRSTAAGMRPTGGGSTLGAWMRVMLGLALAAGMALWPYSHVCGGKLLFYLGGVGTLAIAGLWSAVSSWHRRLGVAHVLSLATLLWALVLAAGVVLPRVGYAKSDAIWFCPEPVSPPPR